MHEMSNPVFGQNKKNITILSAELAQRVVMVNMLVGIYMYYNASTDDRLL